MSRPLHLLAAASLAAVALLLGCPAEEKGCPSGQRECFGHCVDTQTDENGCGAGCAICPTGASCVAGVCECPAGQEPCGGACVDTATNASHCGACDQPCGLGTCDAGTCTCDAAASECPAGVWPRCADLAGDEANCGSCGHACRPGEECATGSCTCLPGYSDCPAACFDLQRDERNCGSCGFGCPLTNDLCIPPGTCACPPALPDTCGANCVNRETDPDACGPGCVTCPTSGECKSGICSCPPAQPTLCGTSPGACVDLTSDEGHCGTCATACTGGRICNTGKCCLSGQLVCGTTTKLCCDGTGCCPDGSCQRAHSNGLGGTYLDCSDVGTPLTLQDALLAADAWSAGTDVNMAVTACPIGCYGRTRATDGRCAIWCYAGSSYPGRVNEDTLCICPTDLDPPWN